MTCKRCQQTGNISKRHKMPQQGILEVELFDVWEITTSTTDVSKQVDYVSKSVEVPPSYDNLYILMAVDYVSKQVEADYVSKQVEAISTPTNDAEVVIKFRKKNILTRFGMPRALLSDNGTHFCNKPLQSLLKKYGVFHKVARLTIPKQVGKQSSQTET